MKRKMPDLKFGIGKFKDEIEVEIMKNGYHIFNWSMKDSYPNKFPDFPTIQEEDIIIGDRYAVRAFIDVSGGLGDRIESGMLDIQVTMKSGEVVSGKILTTLPVSFPIAKGKVIVVKVEELLYKQQ